MNNSKRRRIASAAARIRGEKGRPHPHGNRAYRRSDIGKAEIRQVLDKLAQRSQP